MNRLRTIEWDAVAGLIAAVAAFVLHFLGVVEQDTLLAIVVLILALIMMRSLRREGREDRQLELSEQTAAALGDLRHGLTPPDVRLVGPSGLGAASEEFARRAQGRMVWFNVCLLMFQPQSLFDALLRPAIENPRVTEIQFVLDASERERWEHAVLPKAAACKGREKLLEPRWHQLEETVSFVLSATEPEGKLEAQVSFWGEPFMSRSARGDLPRFIFHVYEPSELIPRLQEMERSYRGGAP